jgi:hypothetical protein
MAPTSQASSGVASLVASIKQHKKFRQLASYSVQCLCKVITPPHVGWERNLKDAYDSGALEAITDVLQRHHGDEDVLAASTACLSAMATNPKYAAALVDSGAIMGMLQSVMKNPDQKAGVKESLQLLETIASNNPEALLAGGGADAATRLISAAPKNSIIVGASIRTLEKLNKVPGGSQALIDCDAIRTVMEVVSGTKDADTLEASFRLLERVCRTTEHAEYVRNECNGMQVLSSALENSSIERITKIGGRLLSKLASGSVSDLIGRLETSTNAQEKEFLSGLLANLALEEENCEKILSAGGVPALLKVLEGSTKKTVEAASRALGRLATSDDAVEEMSRSGAVQQFVKILGSYSTDNNVASAVASAIHKLANSVDRAQKVARAGGVEAVIKAFVAKPDLELLAVEVLSMIDDLVALDYDVSKLAELGTVEAICKSLKSFIKNEDVQLNGIRALIFFSYSEVQVKTMLANGAVERCLALLENPNKEIVVAAMYLATSISVLPESKAKLGNKGTETLLNAISRYANDPVVRETAEELLSTLVSEEQVAEAIADFGVQLDDLLETKSKPLAAKVKSLVTTISAYSVSPEYAEFVIRAEGVSQLVRALEEVATVPSMPELEGILVGCTRALLATLTSVSSDKELLELVIKSGAVKATVTAVKLHPKLKTHVTSAVAFLEAVASISGLADLVSEDGGVEACVSALRANANAVDVVNSSFNTLLQIASSDKGSVAVAKHGGTRQVIACVSANSGTPAFAAPMEKALALLQRVSQTSEGAEMLIKQGGVDAVISATEALNRFGVEANTSRVLARLLNKDDVIAAVDQLAELGNSAARGRVPGAEAMKPVLAKIGHMSTVAAFTDTIVKEGGAKALAALASIVLTKSEDEEAKAEVLPSIFSTVANISKTSKLDDSLGFAGFISQAIEGSFALTECLSCITNIAQSSEGAASQLCNDGRTLNMVVETLKNNIRNKEIATACFQALASLASHASTAPLVAATPAQRLVSDWLDDNIDDANADALNAALSTLANMALSTTHAASMLEGGAVELVKAVLTKACIESATPAPSVLGGAVEVLSRLGATANAVSRISAAGGFRRVVRAVTTDPAYLKDETAVVRVFDLMKQASQVGAVSNELLQIGAIDLIVAGMNANATSEQVIKKGAAALKALGASEEAGRQSLEEVKMLSTALETAPEITEDMVLNLGDAVQRLGNFMMIEGVVTAANAPQLMSVISNAVALMAESELAPAGILAAAISSVGRLVELGGKSVESSAREAVEMVLDVLALASDAGPVRESSVHTLGQLAGSAAGLASITELGAIDVITDTAKANAGDSKLQAISNAALKKITSQTSRAAATLITSGAGGAATLAAVVQANSNDIANLGSVLSQVATVAGGDEAIYDVIAKPGTSTEVIGEALRVLRDIQDGRAGGIAGNARRSAGLTRALQTALNLQATLTPASDQRTKLQALRLAENTLVLLSKVVFDATGAGVFFAGQGIDNLMQLLAANIEDDETVQRVTSILRAALAYATGPAAATMAQPSNMSAIVGTLKLFMDVKDIVADCAEIMAFTARTTGSDGSGIDREGMRCVSQASVQYPADLRIRNAIAILQSVMSSKFSEAEAVVKAMSQSLQAATAAISTVGTIQEMVTEDGRTYYYNTSSGETTWEAPAAYAQFKAAMSAASDAAKKQQEDSVVNVDSATITSMVNTLTVHARNPLIASSAAQTLAALALNDANSEEIARVGGIRAAIASAQAAPDNVELLKTLLALLERISRSDTYKEQVVNMGGADVLMDIAIGRHLAVEEVALKSLSTMANLAFNSEVNIAALMGKGVVKGVESILQKYSGAPRVLENAMCALSNLMFGSDENKLTIGQTVGDEVTNIIRDHPNDGNLFKMSLRALGNLSFCDENIRFIVEEHHATKAIVAGMRAHPKDEEAQQLAMEVIGNFASLEEAPPEVDAEGNVINPKDSINSIVLREAGCAQIIANIKQYQHNSSVTRAGLDALANIANDVEVTEVMAHRQNLVPAVIEVMQANDWDLEVVSRAVNLIAVMTYAKSVQPLLAQLDGIQVLLAAMEQHGTNPDVLSSAQLALTNLAGNEESRTAIRNMEGVPTILSLLEANVTNKDYVAEVMKTLTRLCSDDSLSHSVASRGMHIIMTAIDRFSRDPDFLSVAFRLLGHLAFVEANLTVIVQHNGIQKVIQAITSHPDSQGLMVRCIQTLDNIAMANKENAAIVIDEGGKELIETIKETYPENPEIAKAGNSALLSLSALENLSKSAEITAKAARMGANKKKNVDEGPKDPLHEYRALLKAGKVLKVWHKGSSTAAHVLCSPDFRSVVWQEVKPPQKKLGALDLRTVTGVRLGTNDGHKKGVFSTSKPVDADCAFTVLTDRGSLDFEANNPKDADTWTKAIALLLKLFRENPQAL